MIMTVHGREKAMAGLDFLVFMYFCFADSVLLNFGIFVFCPPPSWGRGSDVGPLQGTTCVSSQWEATPFKNGNNDDDNDGEK